MIVRTWRGTTRSEDSDEYLEYLRRTGIASYLATPGNRGVATLRRPLVAEGLVEFFLCSRWDSLEAIRAFAGDDIERAVFYPEDERFLVGRDERVFHYEVADEH